MCFEIALLCHRKVFIATRLLSAHSDSQVTLWDCSSVPSQSVTVKLSISTHLDVQATLCNVLRHCSSMPSQSVTLTLSISAHSHSQVALCNMLWDSFCMQSQSVTLTLSISTHSDYQVTLCNVLWDCFCMQSQNVTLTLSFLCPFRFPSHALQSALRLLFFAIAKCNLGKLLTSVHSDSQITLCNVHWDCCLHAIAKCYLDAFDSFSLKLRNYAL